MPNRAEALLDRVDEILASGVPRWHPFFENAYSGGGFTLGVGYTHSVSPYNTVDVRGSYTVRRLQARRSGVLPPRACFIAGACSRSLGGWREATQAAFYGIGHGHRRRTIATNTTSAAVRVGAAHAPADAPSPDVARWSRAVAVVAAAGARASFRRSRPCTTPSTLPGLGANATYVHSQGTVGFDWRTSPGYARRGGFYGVTFHDYSDLDEQFGFRQVDYEAIQHLPILREAWVISFRGLAQHGPRPRTTSRSRSSCCLRRQRLERCAASAVGASAIRTACVLQAEWRIMANRFLDTAIFYDAGKVAARRADLDFNGLQSDYGFGVRFHGPFATPLRVEVPSGPKASALIFASSAIF